MKLKKWVAGTYDCVADPGIRFNHFPVLSDQPWRLTIDRPGSRPRHVFFRTLKEAKACARDWWMPRFLYQHFSSKRALYLELVDSIARDLLEAIEQAVRQADGPRQQVELGFAAYFRLVVSHEAEFRILYGRDHADDDELGRALRTVEDAIAEAIDPLIDAGLDDDHRRLLAYGIVGMAEGASRRFLEQRPRTEAEADEEAQRLAQRMADLAWAGLRSVHKD